MVSYGDEVDVNDYGVCKLDEEGEFVIYLVEEEDDSINWYLNYERSDDILTTRKANFVRDR